MGSPTVQIRRSQDRGHANHGWLDSYHSFSFADYQDPAHVQFGALRVINEDRIRPGTGFGSHPHKDMEIISYVLAGALEHKDSLGNGSVIRPGDVQRMSAGRGVTHSEFNPSSSESSHFLQIWILPRTRAGRPNYEQRHFPARDKRGRLALLASADGRAGSLTVDQDVNLYAGLFDGDERAAYSVAPGRRLYVHIARGRLTVNGNALEAGDALMASEADAVSIDSGENAEVLVFDLA